MRGLANEEEFALLVCRGIRNEFIIGQDPDGTWSMYYRLAFNGGIPATIKKAKTRDEIVRRTKECMIGHARALIENLFQDAEKWKPTTTNNQCQ